MLTADNVVELANALHHLTIPHSGVTSRETRDEILAGMATFDKLLATAEAGTLDAEATPFLRALALAADRKPWRESPAQLAQLKARAAKVLQ